MKEKIIRQYKSDIDKAINKFKKSVWHEGLNEDKDMNFDALYQTEEILPDEHLKLLFKTGDKPYGVDFELLINAKVHKNELEEARTTLEIKLQEISEVFKNELEESNNSILDLKTEVETEIIRIKEELVFISAVINEEVERINEELATLNDKIDNIDVNIDLADLEEVKKLLEGKSDIDHTHEASNITFEDGETLQSKLDSGSLGGEENLGTTVVTGMKVRYIRDWLNGSDKYPQGGHWLEIQAFTFDRTNVATNKKVKVTSSHDIYIGNLEEIVDGVVPTSGGSFVGIDVGKQPVYIQVDLGQTYDLEKIKVWHPYTDERSYNYNLLEVSADGSNWTPVWSSEINGTYVESANGKEHTLSTKIESRYIKNTGDTMIGDLSMGLVGYEDPIGITFNRVFDGVQGEGVISCNGSFNSNLTFETYSDYNLVSNVELSNNTLFTNTKASLGTKNDRWSNLYLEGDISLSPYQNTLNRYINIPQLVTQTNSPIFGRNVTQSFGTSSYGALRTISKDEDNNKSSEMAQYTYATFFKFDGSDMGNSGLYPNTSGVYDLGGPTKNPIFSGDTILKWRNGSFTGSVEANEFKSDSIVVGGKRIVVSTEAPANPNVGDIWIGI